MLKEIVLTLLKKQPRLTCFELKIRLAAGPSPDGAAIQRALDSLFVEGLVTFEPLGYIKSGQVVYEHGPYYQTVAWSAR